MIPEEDAPDDFEISTDTYFSRSLILCIEKVQEKFNLQSHPALLARDEVTRCNKPSKIQTYQARGRF